MMNTNSSQFEGSRTPFGQVEILGIKREDEALSNEKNPPG